MLYSRKHSGDDMTTTTLKPTVCGVGINDVPGSWGKPYYKVWENMLRRCYDPKCHAIKPHYTNCTVDPRWHHLSDFKRWYEQQGDVTRKHLDKDIISPGNKIYGPDTCFFVTGELNNFFTKSDSSRGKCLIGVSFHKKERKFHSKVTDRNKTLLLGRFDTELEAHQVFMQKKKKLLLERYILPETNERLKNALMNVYNNMEEYFK